MCMGHEHSSQGIESQGQRSTSTSTFCQLEFDRSCAILPFANAVGLTMMEGSNVCSMHPSHCCLVDCRVPVRSSGVHPFFTARRYASAVYHVCCGPVSVCLCLSVSVTSRSSTKTAKYRITQTTPHDSPGTLVVRCHPAGEKSSLKETCLGLRDPF